MILPATLSGLLALSSIAHALPGPPINPTNRRVPFSGTAAAVAGVSKAANTTACATGVHMIIARASTESPGPGIIGAVATQVQTAVAGSDSESVDYPATLTDYMNSEASGVAGMQKLITSYVTRCM